MLLPGSVGIALLALAGVLVALPSVLMSRRGRRLESERRLETAAQAPQAPVARLGVADPDDAAAAVEELATLDGGRWAAMEGELEALLPRLTGQTRAAVVDLLAQKGTLARALAGTRSRSVVRRTHGAEVLGAAGSRAAVPDLVHLLSDPQRDVRTAAARALGQIRAPEAAVPLLHCVTGPRSVPPAVLSAAVLAMGVRAHEALGVVLRTGNEQQRAVAAELAGLSGAVGTIDVLVELLHEDPDLRVRVQVARALGLIAAAPALAALLAAVGDDQPRVLRTTAVAALGSLGAAAAVPRLAELTLDGDARLAEAAAAALRRCGAVGLRALNDLAGLEDGACARAEIASPSAAPACVPGPAAAAPAAATPAAAGPTPFGPTPCELAAFERSPFEPSATRRSA
ncbi:MAG: HEAT repeat domain-containing protein [Actinomycetes bacterium]